MDSHTEFIIQEVEKCPVLWDKKHKSYHYRDIVDNNWQILAKITRMQKVQLKRKWKGLRDQFRVELKKIPNASSDDCEITDELVEKYTVWPHFKSLLFLKGQMKMRGTKTSIEYIETNECESSRDDDTLNDPLTPTTFHLEEPLEEKPAMKRAQPMTKIEAAKISSPSMKRQKLRNDDEAFFESLLPYFDNMGMKTKMLCRMEIQKVVYNYAFSSNVSEQREAIEEEQNVAIINLPVPIINEDKKPFNLQEFIM